MMVVSQLLSASVQLAFTRRAAPAARSAPLEIEVAIHELIPPALHAASKTDETRSGLPSGGSLGVELARARYPIPSREGIPVSSYSPATDALEAARAASNPAAFQKARSGGTSARYTGKIGVGAVYQLDSGRERRGTVVELHLPYSLIRAPKLWSSEAPNLYCITLTLREQTRAGAGGRAGAPSAAPLEALTFAVGFRQVTVDRNQVKLNGQPILVKGVRTRNTMG